MRYKHSQQEIEKAIKDSLSIAQTLQKLGIVAAGGNYKTLKARIENLKIDTSHFTGAAWNQGIRYKNFGRVADLDSILVKDSKYSSTYGLKNKLFKANIKKKTCELCSNNKWLGKPIALELHHINGVNNDNRIENLQILCPNCHATTDNYRGKNQSRVK